jgi:G:T-mismatch repair DNA endonuclease (very short patch repair protein)
MKFPCGLQANIVPETAQMLHEQFDIATDVVWECAIKGRSKKNLGTVIDELENWLHDSASKGIEISGLT